MGNIYRNSVCTISALGFKDSNGGCFKKRHPLLYRPCRLIGDQTSGVYAYGHGDPEEHNDGNRRLNRRAWVVQNACSPSALFITGVLEYPGNVSQVRPQNPASKASERIRRETRR